MATDDYKSMRETRFKTHDWGFTQVVLSSMKSVEQQQSFIGMHGFNTDEIKGFYLSVRSFAKLLFPYVGLSLKEDISKSIKELDKHVTSIGNYNNSGNLNDLSDKRNFVFGVGDLLAICYKCLPYIGIKMTEIDYGEVDDEEYE
jgi:hypothetical protein